MSYVEYAKQRYDAAICEIERLKQSEFPYAHIRDALLQMESVFRQQRVLLDKLTTKSTPAIAKNACSESLAHLFNYTPYLGLILRATNVRNAFEIYAPVLRLARQLLGNNTKLLLSSEWDYSPFVYLPTAELPNFVLIGVPAFESSNPLLLSLAGHELGHNVWAQKQYIRHFDSLLKAGVLAALKGKHWADFRSYQPAATEFNLTTDMFVQQAWLPAYMFASRQLEEVFCDMMGLRLFGEAYLNAFAYLLSPGIPGERYPYYPTIATRVEFLQRAAAVIGVAVPAGYRDLFESQAPSSKALVDLLVAVADDAVGSLVDQAITEAVKSANEKGIPERSQKNIDSIKHDFQKVMPTNGKTALTDIINAGWESEKDNTLWANVSQIRSEDRRRVLHDLMLKSLEVSEFYERISGP